MTEPAANQSQESAHARVRSESHAIARSMARKCGAKTRAGERCQGIACRGRERCRVHGGTNPGAPKENANARTHGVFAKFVSAKDIEEVEALRGLDASERADFLKTLHQARTLRALAEPSVDLDIGTRALKASLAGLEPEAAGAAGGITINIPDNRNYLEDDEP